MKKRFLSIWFPYLLSDYYAIQQPKLKGGSFVVTRKSRGRMLIIAASSKAELNGISIGMSLADAKALHPELQHIDEVESLPDKLLKKIAQWCIRFSPVAAIDPPAGVLLDITGCAHIWGGEKLYMDRIREKLHAKGYQTKAGIAGTIGLAWALARYETSERIALTGNELNSIAAMPPSSLRIDPGTEDVFNRLGLHSINQLINLPRHSMRRRFGAAFLLRLDQALGTVTELIHPVHEPSMYEARLPCLEPIATAKGIEIALEQLLNDLCSQLVKASKGSRIAILRCYRVDNKIEKLTVNTTRPSHNAKHLFKLFEIKIDTLEPAMGIELFTLEAVKVEDHEAGQSVLWNNAGGIRDPRIGELIDHLATRLGAEAIQRFIPAEHHWPERSLTRATSLDEQSHVSWASNKLRPVWIMKPELIQVTAPVPDYPPMNFRHNGIFHHVKKADGPERIEPEWWLQPGEHRDYYLVEDENGCRYWIFRSGHYDSTKKTEWFLHGYFA